MNKNVAQKLYPLQVAIGYFFKDITLLGRALTHCSVGEVNNERFEFLGDSFVNLIIAEALYTQFPKAREGELTRLRAMCVKGDTLAAIAQSLKIGTYLKLGIGEMRSGGAQRPSILADAMEAIIASIYLDSDFETVRSIVLKWYAPQLEQMSLSSLEKDPKTELQEWLQARKQGLPHYTVLNVTGESHHQIFLIRCEIAETQIYAEATGESRKKAEQSAARIILEKLKSSKSG